ncbi:MAG: hypothetical protein KQ78_01642 [Candidatus Izimaplasma bacterium HR2]|nr:MAG: hypothetical protein KQ78_01642 [Candidatus Izimaplasma bacterium HR2]
MLNKLKKLLILIVVISGVGYGGFLVFVTPAGFTDKEVLINSYFTNIQSEEVCTDHFNSETTDFCLNFQTLLDDKTLEIASLTKNGENYIVIVTVDDVDIEFDVSFIEIEVTGVKSFLNNIYYKIDIIT